MTEWWSITRSARGTTKLKPGGTRTIRGKIYLMPADVAALLARYRVDFPEHHRQLPTGHDGSRPRKLIEFERFHAALCAALHGSDEYVWIYTEKPRWWSNDGKLLELPDAYVQSIRRAREKYCKD